MSKKIESRVLVCGGGTAGMIAAIAAARNGASTVLLEREGFLGGVAAAGIPFLAFFRGDGQQVVAGIAQELVDRMVREGGCPGHGRGAEWNRNVTGGSYDFSLTPYDPEIFKYVIQEMVLEAGVKLYLQTTLSEVKKKKNRITSLEAVTVAGKRTFSADVFIDATGDALVTSWGGFPVTMRGPGKMQNVSHIMRIGNVDTRQMEKNLEEGKGILGRDEWHTRIVKGDLLNGKKGLVHMAGLMDAWDDAPPHTFTAVGWREEEMSFNLTRTVSVDPTDPEDITRAEISERRNMHKTVEALKKKIPGFENAYLVSSSVKVGIREGVRIKGEAVLDEKSVVNGLSTEEGIALGAYPIDVHDPRGGNTQFTFIKAGGSYAVPYLCLIPKGAENLLAAGRCVSVTGKAHGSVRLMSTCMALGQAAGTAAAMAVKKGVSPKDVPAGKLRKQLKADGGIVDSP